MTNKLMFLISASVIVGILWTVLTGALLHWVPIIAAISVVIYVTSPKETPKP